MSNEPAVTDVTEEAIADITEEAITHNPHLTVEPKADPESEGSQTGEEPRKRIFKISTLHH